jgi:hypothetical protein
LELKCQSVFEQAFELQERLAEKKEEKLKQRALCEQLAAQVDTSCCTFEIVQNCFLFEVEKWREKQLEMLNIKRQLDESRRQAEQEKIREENERLLKDRQKTKDKVSCDMC